MKYEFLTTKEISPEGWLRRQLELEADGLCGNLDRVWPDVKDSKWIGGEREGWERVPYWLDGFIPLAFLLDNNDMISRAKYYIDHILASQCEDGWICPNGDKPREKYDVWAIHLISKVLVVWYDCSGDERIPSALYRIMRNFYELIVSGGVKIFQWAKFRWFEGFIALSRLKKWYPEDTWINDLCIALKETGANYSDYEDSWKKPLNKWTLYTHVVNIAMMLKSEAVSCELLNEDYKGLGEYFYNEIMKYNATPVGTFTGDECLSGISPIQGTELCAVVELMYSMEWLFAYTGDEKWAERLEKVAFNALPAAISDDMWAHQYDQMSNQIDCTPLNKEGKAIFRTNRYDAHVFGLEPHYGCCTSNFGQGWPKLAISSFMRADDGLICAVSVPVHVNVNWKGTPVSVSLETNYPFRNTFLYRVNSMNDTDMKLYIRVPSFAKKVMVNGSSCSNRRVIVFDGFKSGDTVIEISYEAEPTFERSPSGMYCASYGSLVFSLPISKEVEIHEYTQKGVERKFPYCDYHYKRASEWERAYASRELLVLQKDAVDNVPFSSTHPSIALRAQVCPINWGYEEGYETICAKKPNSRKPLGEAEPVELYPYGCAKLRMTEMPMAYTRTRSEK